MARKTGLRRKAYWASATTLITGAANSIVATGDPTYAQCVAAFPNTAWLAGVTGMPDYGDQPSQVLSEEFGEATARQVASQQQPSDAVIASSFDEISTDTATSHKALEELASGQPILLALWTITNAGTGASAGHPNGTGATGTFRLLEGAKSGSGLVPGGTVNDVETYQLSIAVARRLTVYQA